MHEGKFFYFLDRLMLRTDVPDEFLLMSPDFFKERRGQLGMIADVLGLDGILKTILSPE
jgi:hypothetical protein